MVKEKALLMKMADILCQENLISYAEQQKMKALIRESEEI